MKDKPKVIKFEKFDLKILPKELSNIIIGAFVMGMGFWLFEDIKYDPITGKNLSRGTWEYKVPSTKGF